MQNKVHAADWYLIRVSWGSLIRTSMDEHTGTSIDRGVSCPISKVMTCHGKSTARKANDSLAGEAAADQTVYTNKDQRLISIEKAE